jgi:hypothetical protein
MMRNPVPLVAVATVAYALVPALSIAYVDVELDNGRHVAGESYEDRGDKVVVHRPLGAIEVDRATVRSIRELSGEMPADVQRNLSPAAAAALQSSSSQAQPSRGGAAVASTDPQARQREITAKLFEVYRVRLAAKNRGDDAEFQKLDKEATQLENERAKVAGKNKSSDGATPKD